MCGGVQNAAAVEMPVLLAAATHLPERARLGRAYLSSKLYRVEGGEEDAPGSFRTRRCSSYCWCFKTTLIGM